MTGVQGDSANVDLDRLYETVKREKGYIDVVFASAGHGGRTPLGEITEEQFDSIFSLNTRGTLFTVQKALPMMRNGGSIIMNGSIAHLKGMPGLGVYAGSKAALRSFARSWAVELAERRIRVNVLSPGRLLPTLSRTPLRKRRSTSCRPFLVRSSDARKRLRRRLYFSPPTTRAS